MAKFDKHESNVQGPLMLSLIFVCFKSSNCLIIVNLIMKIIAQHRRVSVFTVVVCIFLKTRDK